MSVQSVRAANFRARVQKIYLEWAHAALQPLVNRLEAEFRAKLEQPVTLSLDPLFASDLTGRARAFQSLVGAGMEVEKAAGLAGLLQR